MQEQDITELAKRVLELAEEVHKPKSSTYESRRASANFSNFMWEAAPKLAQAVLDLIVMLDSANKTTQLHSDVAKHAVNRALKAEGEISALRPDALAWREREARYQAEKQELEKRMGK